MRMNLRLDPGSTPGTRRRTGEWEKWAQTVTGSSGIGKTEVFYNRRWSTGNVPLPVTFQRMVDSYSHTEGFCLSNPRPNGKLWVTDTLGPVKCLERLGEKGVDILHLQRWSNSSTLLIYFIIYIMWIRSQIVYFSWVIYGSMIAKDEFF